MASSFFLSSLPFFFSFSLPSFIFAFFSPLGFSTGFSFTLGSLSLSLGGLSFTFSLGFFLRCSFLASLSFFFSLALPLSPSRSDLEKEGLPSSARPTGPGTGGMAFFSARVLTAKGLPPRTRGVERTGGGGERGPTSSGTCEGGGGTNRGGVGKCEAAPWRPPVPPRSCEKGNAGRKPCVGGEPNGGNLGEKRPPPPGCCWEKGNTPEKLGAGSGGVSERCESATRGDPLASGPLGSWPFFGDGVPEPDLVFPDFFLPLVFSLGNFLCGSGPVGGRGKRSGVESSLCSLGGAGEPARSGVLGVGGGDESESVKSYTSRVSSLRGNAPCMAASSAISRFSSRRDSSRAFCTTASMHWSMSASRLSLSCLLTVSGESSITSRGSGDSSRDGVSSL
uniref:Uncharacterized protein n=1 Tax=Ixodes ricinus TaxID=34613 RepID=A0A147BD85_IXORI